MSSAISIGAVYNYKSRLGKDGKAEVSIRAYQNGKRVYIPTGVKISPENWDKKKAKVKSTAPNYIEQNKIITSICDNLERFIYEKGSKGIFVSLDSLLDYVRPKVVCTEFIQYTEDYIKRSRSLKENSKKGYRSVLKHLRAFRKRIEFHELTYRLICDIDNFLLERVGINTAGKYLKMIRALINQGIKEGVISEDINPFRGYRIQTEPTPPKYLLPAEIEAIEGANLSEYPEGLEYIRDMYLFALYTGLRISDTKQVTPKNLEEVEGEIYLIVESMQKTKEAVRLPLNTLFNGKALQILKRYESGKDTPYFARYCDQYVNRKLKELAGIVGIKKRLTFHTARHTTATYLTYKGVALGVVQRVLGHTKQSTTEIYAKTLAITIQNELKLAFEM